MLLTRYGGNSYHTVMGNMIDQIEALADAQRSLENVYSYSNKYLRLVDKNVKKANKWRVILKWSTKVSSNCILEEQKQMDMMNKLELKEKNSMQHFGNLAKTFQANARKDYMKWDCEAMYPMPKQFKVDVIKTILDAGKQGFAIFNEVKGMLPEGTMSKLKIPGLPEGMQSKVTEGVKMFNQAKGIFDKFAGGAKEEFEEFEEDLDFDLEEEDMTELKFLGGESSGDFAKRVALRNKYVATCEKGKAEFK